jgi:hypothetical protein
MAVGISRSEQMRILLQNYEIGFRVCLSVEMADAELDGTFWALLGSGQANRTTTCQRSETQHRRVISVVPPPFCWASSACIFSSSVLHTAGTPLTGDQQPQGSASHRTTQTQKERLDRDSKRRPLRAVYCAAKLTQTMPN